ncbi:MAG: sulfatase-like hydrolase/transferase [Planctomycetaceae bacterium]
MLRLLLSGVCLLVWMCGTAISAAPPNIVFIMADDLGWGDVAFHDGPAPTPHLDRLATTGVELTQHYVAPVCSPTRTALLSGRYWSRFGVTNPQNSRAYPWETVTLARALKSVGYDTALTGKWHLGSLPEEGPLKFGFDHSYGSLAGGVGPWNHVYKTGPFSETWHRNDVRLHEDGHVTDLITREAVQWIESRTAAPFFLYVPFTAVHLPIKEPQPWLDAVPASIKGDVPRQYSACVMHLDDAVGRIIEAIDAAGKRNSTVVVFTSDNGGSWAENNDTRYAGDVYDSGKLVGRNEPLRGQKTQLYEGGIRVPAVVNWPGTLPSSQVQTPIHIADWMPTFSALAGYQPDQDLNWDGRNVWPQISGQSSSEERTLYWVGTASKSKAVRVGDWKLIVQNPGPKQTVELFNLADDPSETVELATTQPDRVRLLLQTLQSVSASDRDAVAKNR